MTALLVVGLVSGLVTAVSPCVLPVLPVVLTTSAGRRASPWRPVAVVGGMVLSFGVATLLGAAVLGGLGLPQDALRWAGIAVLAVVGGTWSRRPSPASDPCA
jgi:cytochrome c biogenesis protein CcdA